MLRIDYIQDLTSKPNYYLNLENKNLKKKKFIKSIDFIIVINHELGVIYCVFKNL